MPELKLPYVDIGKTDKETIQNILDTIFKYRKELEYVMNQLDFGNMAPVIKQEITIAKELSEAKSKVFVSQPVPPYNIGDLWSQGIEGDLLKCIVAKTKDETYSLSDWELASKTIDEADLNPTAATAVVALEGVSVGFASANFIVPTGSTSAQTIINQALASVENSKGTVLLAEGTYTIDGSILIGSRVNLVGMGAGTIIKLKSGSSVDLIKNNNQAFGNTDISISNLTLDCSSTSIKAINFDRVSRSKLTRLYVTGGDTALYLIRSSENIIDSNVFENNGYAIYLASLSDGNTINANTAKVGNGFGVIIASGKNNNITANNFSNGVLGVYCWGQQNNIVGNIMNYNNGWAMRILDSHNQIVGNKCFENGYLYSPAGTSQLRIENNYNNIQNNHLRRGNVASHPQYGIEITVGSTANVVTNNDLYQAGYTSNLRDQGTGTITTAGNRL